VGNVWVTGSSKGGVGKTSNSIALAAYLARHGYRIACVDADPNQALANWHRISDHPGIDISTETDEDAIVAHLLEKPQNSMSYFATPVAGCIKPASFPSGLRIS
jgi:chromosome partitioning protein